MAAVDQAPVREGDVLAKKYRVEKVLGVGGMGVVVAAMHLQLDQRVALKFLHGEALNSSEAIARFAREARAAAKIKSEHVARVIDVGELDSGSPYLVMEFLEGEDLGQRLDRGALGAAEAVGFVLQACDAIAEAHASSIVHRDLKPSNLFLAKRPDKTSIIKVLDFGISKSTNAVQQGQLTSTQALLGSPLYMSPEQMMAPKTVDQRTDIWALGVILHELLSGNVPFTAETMPELVAKIIATSPTLLSDVRTDVPEGLALVVGRCLEKDRNLRFANVAALASALLPFAPEEARRLPERISRVLGEAAHVSPSAATVVPNTAPLNDARPKANTPANAALPSLYESSVASQKQPETEIYESTLRLDGGTPPAHEPHPMQAQGAVQASTQPSYVPAQPPQRTSSPSHAPLTPIGGTIAKSAWGATQSEIPQPPRSGPPLGAIVGIVVAAVMAGIIVLVVRMRNGDAPTDKTSASSAPATISAVPETTLSAPKPEVTAADAGSPAVSVSALATATPTPTTAPTPLSKPAVGTKPKPSATTKPENPLVLMLSESAHTQPQPQPQPQPPPEPTNKMKMDVK